MSHYRVAVVRRQHQDADELLAKYSENLRVKPYICLTREEALKEADNTIKKYADGTYSGSDWGDKLAKAKETSEDELIKLYAEYTGHELDENGNQLSTYNPLSKYDYYGEIDSFDTIKEYAEKYPPKAEDSHAAYKARVFWRHIVEGKPLPKKFAKDEYFNAWYTKEYYIKKYGDMETFVKFALANLPTYAFVLDDKWYAPGEVGWWASEHNISPTSTKEYLEAWEKVLKDPELQNAELLIYDMHI